MSLPEKILMTIVRHFAIRALGFNPFGGAWSIVRALVRRLTGWR